MTLPKVKEINNLTIEEIQNRIIQIKKDILNLQLQKATKQNIKPHVFKHKKHELAQLLTLETLKIKKSR